MYSLKHRVPFCSCRLRAGVLYSLHKNFIMKPLAFRFVAVATVLFFLLSAFTMINPQGMADPAAGAVSKPSAQSGSAAQKFDVYYYWFDVNNNYLGWMDAAQMAGVLEEEYQVWVDEDTIGGTLLAEGYADGSLPHDEWPACDLYGHF